MQCVLAPSRLGEVHGQPTAHHRVESARTLQLFEARHELLRVAQANPAHRLLSELCFEIAAHLSRRLAKAARGFRPGTSQDGRTVGVDLGERCQQRLGRLALLPIRGIVRRICGGTPKHRI